MDVLARQIFDSRGNPTVEVEVHLASGAKGLASVPSGASTGRHEAHELRDGLKAFGGHGVLKAVQNVQEVIGPEIAGMDALDQRAVDTAMMVLDGTETKERLGANAILGVSLAVARAGADALGIPLFRYLGGPLANQLPVPMLNVVNGGKHADNALGVQEFMIVPVGFDRFKDAMGAAVEVYWALKSELRAKGQRTAVGDEGGFAPDIEDDEEGLRLLAKAIEMAGFKPGKEVAVALDLAANELRTEGGYRVGGKAMDTGAYLDVLASWSEAYPVLSMEDAMAEDDLEGWKALTKRLGKKIQLVGDDVFVTNSKRLQMGASDGIGNAILVKPNQVGTLTETMDTIRLAKELGYRTVVSHRSGETEDTFIADLAVGLSAGQIKTGAPARQERVAKYNQLLRIEGSLSQPEYPARLVFDPSRC